MEDQVLQPVSADAEKRCDPVVERQQQQAGDDGVGDEERLEESDSGAQQRGDDQRAGDDPEVDEQWPGEVHVRDPGSGDRRGCIAAATGLLAAPGAGQLASRLVRRRVVAERAWRSRCGPCRCSVANTWLRLVIRSSRCWSTINSASPTAVSRSATRSRTLVLMLLAPRSARGISRICPDRRAQSDRRRCVPPYRRAGAGVTAPAHEERDHVYVLPAWIHHPCRLPCYRRRVVRMVV